jgi:hypothetical protein
LQITVDPITGLLMNNRFAAGDPGFISPYDFGGGQTLAASAASTINILDQFGYSVVLGTNKQNSAASDLLAKFFISTLDGTGTVSVNDGARQTAGDYTLNQAAGALALTLADGTMNVTIQGSSFGGGVTLTTGQGNNSTHVDASRSGEGLTLDSLNPQEVVDIGDGNVQNINGNVSVTNSAPGGTTDLYVDNELGVNAGPVTISGTSITGLAPAAILYSNKRTDDVVIIGGSTASTYFVTGSLGGSTLGLATGSGLDTVLVSNNGVVNDTFFPGTLSVQGSEGQDELNIDNGNGAAAGVALTNRVVRGVNIGVVNGFTFRPIQFTGFATLALGLGGTGNTFSANSTTANPAKIEVTSAGDLTLAQTSLQGNNLDVTTTAGNVTVAGPIATDGGTLFVHTPGANHIQVNQTINTGPGSGGKVRAGGNVNPQPPNALYVPGAGNILLNAPVSIVVFAGSPQSTLVTTAFATTLQALVLDSHGNPVGSGVSVTFAAPGGGAGGTFANHMTTEIDVTNASGVATSSTFTANNTAGSYTVTASTAGTSDLAGFSLTNTAPVVVGQFGTAGVWQFNSTLGTWVQLRTANATMLASNPQGVVVGEFPTTGVWQFLPGSGWTQLTTVDAAALVMDAQGDVTGVFHGAGVWQYTPGKGWTQLTTSDASILTASASGVAFGEFAHYGVWQFNPGAGWKQRTVSDASLLAADPQGDLAAEFPHYGVWQYLPASGWKQLTISDATALAAGAAGLVVGDFHGAGVWRFLPGSGWGQLTAVDAALLQADALGGVYGTFAGAGVWQFDPVRGWHQMTAVDASVLAVA